MRAAAILVFAVEDLSSLRRSEMFIDRRQAGYCLRSARSEMTQLQTFALLTQLPTPQRLIGYKHVTPAE